MDSSGGYTEINNETTVDTVYYNDLTTGTLEYILENSWTKSSFYALGDSATLPAGEYFFIYGSQQYATSAEAMAAALPTPPTFFGDAFVPIASLTYQASGTDVIVADIRPRLGATEVRQGESAGRVTVHSSLLGLDEDDHDQYLLVDGVRSMTGNLNIGGNNITNVNLVDGVDVSSHAARHLPAGDDELTVGIPSDISTANAEGILPAFARQDHIHNHGNQTNVYQHALATSTTHGFAASADKNDLTSVYSFVNTTSSDYARRDEINVFTKVNTFTDVVLISALSGYSGTIVPAVASGQSLGTQEFPWYELYLYNLNLNALATENPPWKEGRLFYNNVDHTITFFSEISDSSLQIGQESWIRGYNNTGSTILNGQSVALSGQDGNGWPQFCLAGASVATLADHFVGLATHDIPNGTYGYVTNFGQIRDINTSGFQVGDAVYLGTTLGSITSVASEAPNINVHIGHVVTSHATSGVICIADIIKMPTINQLSDVDGTSPSDGNLLIWNTALSAWSRGGHDVNIGSDNLTTSGLISTTDGTSNNWNSTHTTVNSNSAIWEDRYYETSVFLYPQDVATTTTLGNWAYANLGSNAETHFNWYIPEHFGTLKSAVVIIIPDATETIQYDLNASVAKPGELYNADDRSSLDQTLAVTVNTLTEINATSVLTSLTSGDYISLNFESDTNNLRVVGMKISYIAR